MVKSNQWAAWVSAVWIVMGAAAVAQNPAPCTTPVALGALSLGQISTVGLPYSATVVTTVDKKQADGSIVHASVTTYKARDSAGRTWEERSLGCQPGADGERHPVLQMLVYDPGTQTTISWKVGDPAKVYHSLHTAPVALPPVTTDKQQEAKARRMLARMGIQTEDLGSKMIAGVIADGTRTVNTVPAGQAGNDQPIKIVDESWVFTHLDLEMLNIDDNSATGKTTTEVVDLKLGEPDVSLFALPAGYTIAAASPARSVPSTAR